MSLQARITAAFQAVAADIKALGTAAYGVITTSASDTTAGRLLKVGDHGAGSLILSTGALTDINNINLPSAKYGYGANTVGAPSTSPGTLEVYRYSNAAARQVARPVNGAADSNITYERQIRTGPVYGDWVPNYSSASLGAQAATFLAATTVSGQLAALGLQPTAWQPASMNGSWFWNSAVDGATYYEPGYSKTGNLVFLRGKITLAANPGNNVTMLTLPVGFRPAKRKVLTCFFDRTTPLFFGTCSVFINTDGTVVHVGNSSGVSGTDNHVLFDGMFFDIT